VKNLTEGCNTAEQDSNPGSHSRESEALPLSYCAMPKFSLSRPITQLSNGVVNQIVGMVKVNRIHVKKVCKC